MGAALVYFIMLPFVLWFSLNQQIVGARARSRCELLPKVSDYLSLVTTLLLAFGLCFQLPVVLTPAGHGRRWSAPRCCAPAGATPWSASSRWPRW